MTRDSLPAFLNLGTLLIVLILAVGMALWFFRKRSNRKPMEGRKERNVAADLDRGKVAPRESPRE